MEALYHQTNSLILQCQQEVASWHSSPSQSQLDDGAHHFNVTMETIISNCERLDVLAGKEPPNRRHNAKLRVDQLKNDCRHLQTAIQNISRRRQTWRDQQLQREQLLSQRFTCNQQHREDTSIAIDAALQVNDRLQNSHNGMDNLLGMGGATLANLRDQREMLRNARRRLMGVASTLGLSNTVMRLVERRAVGDRYLLFGGMIATVIVMYLMWRYLVAT